MTSSKPKIVRTDKIPHADIDPDALKVIGRLRRFGHEAYLVGGCVRDLLLGAHPKDFDVITSARPRQVRRIFSNSRVIGRRFRLVHVIFGDNIIEVSTFRADPGEFAEKKSEAEAVPAPEEAAVPEGEASLAPPEAGKAPDEAGTDAGTAPAPETPIEAAARLSDEDARPEAEPVPAPADEAALDEDEDERLEAEPSPGTGAPAESRGREPSPDDADEEAFWDRRRGRRRRPRPEFDGNNIFGTPEEDARRRDFTINAIFYDPERREIIDYVDGLEDVERGLLKPINDPLRAFAEDPVRMIRAVRFAAKLEFEIEETALRAIAEKRPLIAECSQRRLLEEIFKILKGGHAAASFRLMEDLRVLEYLLPEVAEWLAKYAASPLAQAPAGEPAPAPASPAPVEAPAPAETAREHVPSAPAPLPAPETVSPVAAAPVEVSSVKEEAAPAVAEAASAPPAAPLVPPPAPAEPVEIRLGPIPAWEPPDRAIDAYLRVTWEHPPKEGANDWVEDPHEEVVDAVFEAAAFARDVVLERFGYRRLVGEASERQRARAVMKVLQLNGRLGDAIAWVEEQERRPPGAFERDRRPRDRWRRHRRGRGRDLERADGREPARAEHEARAPEPSLPPSGPSASTANRRPPVDRREVLFRYLEGLDKLTSEGVPLETGAHLAALYAPMLRDALDEALSRRTGPRDPEAVVDDIMYPIAQRHSLARRDRDGVKRIVLVTRRLLRERSDAARRGRRRRSRGAGRLFAKDYFQEALVLLWMHARATGEGWEAFRFWQQRALEEQRGGRAQGPHGNGGMSSDDDEDRDEDDRDETPGDSAAFDDEDEAST